MTQIDEHIRLYDCGKLTFTVLDFYGYRRRDDERDTDVDLSQRLIEVHGLDTGYPVRFVYHSERTNQNTVRRVLPIQSKENREVELPVSSFRQGWKNVDKFPLPIDEKKLDLV